MPRVSQALNQDFRHQGILGNVFTDRLVEDVEIEGRRTVAPTITGTAWIFRLNTIVLDHDDPFPEGYTLGDIWI